MDFKPHFWQRRFYEGGLRKIDLRGGRTGGRRLAMEMWIIATAADQHEAELAITDLRERGVAMLTDDGQRYDPPSSPRPRIVFDEEPQR